MRRRAPRAGRAIVLRPFAVVALLSVVLLAAGCGVEEPGSALASRGTAAERPPPVTRSHGCTASLVADIPMTLREGWDPLVAARVNGEPVKLRVETETNYLIDLDGDSALRAGVQPVGAAGVLDTGSGPFRVQEAVLDTLQVGNIELAAVTALVLPDGFYESTSDGALGITFWSQHDVELDPAAGRIRLYDVSGCSRATAAAIDGYASMQFRRGPGGVVLVPVTVDGRQLTALLGTGWRGCCVTRAGAARAGVSAAQLARDERLKGGVEVDARLHRFDSLEIGEQLFQDVTLPVLDVDLPADVVVGMDLLAQQRVWISFATATLFFDRRMAIR